MALASFSLRAEPPAVPGSGPVLMDEIVALVDNSAVLLSDLSLEARILAARREGGAAFLVTPTPTAMKEALEHLITEQAVKQEAQGLQVFTVSAGEIEKAYQDLRALVGNNKFEQFLADSQIDEVSVREIIERGLRAQRYLEGRFQKKAAPTDAEVEAWATAHPAEYAELKPAKAKEAIRARLTKVNLERLSVEFSSDVRARARVRVLHDPALPNDTLRLSGTARVPQSSPDGGAG